MDSIQGRIEGLSAQGGLTPVLRIMLQLTSQVDFPIDLVSVLSRAFVNFSESNKRQDMGMGQYVSEAFLDSNYGSTLTATHSGSLSLLLPLSFDLMGAIEELRHGRDVVLNLGIRINGRERLPDGHAGPRSIVVDVADARGQQIYVTEVVARSTWEELLKQWNYPSGFGDPRKRIQETVELTLEARRQAEEAANAAKSASELTAVIGLSDAYSKEARVLWRRSLVWLAISVGVAFLGSRVMFRFVSESFGGKFSLPEATVRAVVIAAILGVFTLCLRIYEAYCHLEVVNRHRVNIGRTFEAFKAAQPTERAKEIMSAITADNLLAFGKSGFGGKDSPNQGPLAGAKELIRSILEREPRP
jgi:hypothetical protein